MKRIGLFVFFSFILVSCGSKKKTASNRLPSFEWSEDGDTRTSEKRKRSQELEPLKPSDSSLKYSRKEIEEFLNDWWGTPHRMGGISKKGVDCSGLMCVIFDDLYHDPFQYRRAQDIYTELQPINKKEELQVGDLVFFKVGGVRIDHVGIYLGEGDFAHASSSKGVMVSNLSNSYWYKRYFRGGRKK
jgi:lipoprotein Spr